MARPIAVRRRKRMTSEFASSSHEDLARPAIVGAEVAVSCSRHTFRHMHDSISLVSL